MAGGEGFEPPHTDSESAVLPLDEPPTSQHNNTTTQIIRPDSYFFVNTAFHQIQNIITSFKKSISRIYPHLLIMKVLTKPATQHKCKY